MARNKDKAVENVFARPEVPVETTEEVVVKEEKEPKEYNVWVLEDTPAPEVEQVTVEVSIKVNTKKEEEVKDMNEPIIFYYGFYSVNHPTRKGMLMEPLHSITGETRKCPCNSIAIKLENVVALCENGYILKNLDRSLFRGRSISKKNIKAYVEYITNMINNGFLQEQ